MRKLTILFALFCLSTCWGQRKVILDSIQKFINARIDDPKIKAPIDEFFTNYLSSKPIQENELWENKVGICIDVLVQKNSVIYYPAKFDINYINISQNAFSIEDQEDPTGRKLYIEQFMKKERSKIQKSAYFKHVKFQYSDYKTEKSEINTGDILIENKRYSAFFRSKGDYVYGLAIANTHLRNIGKAIYKLYIFDKKLLSLEDQWEIHNNQNVFFSTAKTNFSLYHEKRINELIVLLRELLKRDPTYKNDSKLVAIYERLKEEEPLNKESLWLVKDMLPYLADLKIEESQGRMPLYNLQNIAHFAAHSLADIYYGNKEYDKAEKYFLKALYEAPYEQISATTVKKDNERIFLDLISIYQETTDKTNKIIAYSLPLLASYYYQEKSNELLTPYIPKGKKARAAFKEEIDKVLHSALTTDNGDIEIDFKGEKVRFWYYEIKQFVEKVKDSDFYKKL